MSVTLINLASGSRGNVTLLRSAQGSLLVDCGVSAKQISERLLAVGASAASLDGVLITHEHNDHIGGLYVLAKKYGLTVYITEKTHEAWRSNAKDSSGRPVEAARVEHIESGKPFCIKDIEVSPFTIPHDAADPVGYVFRSEGVKVGVVTDLGYMPANVSQQLRGCHGLMIESNHDLEMLRNGGYPWPLKQRILSRVGHLSNAALAEHLSTAYDGAAAWIMLAHLSEQNNHAEIARREAEEALARRANGLFADAARTRVLVARQSEPTIADTL